MNVMGLRASCSQMQEQRQKKAKKTDECKTDLG